MPKNSIYNRNADVDGLANINRFDGFFQPLYRQRAVNGVSFVFFTRPKLFINPTPPNSASEAKDRIAYNNMCSDPFFSLFLDQEVVNEVDAAIVKNLSYKDDLDSNFIKILTNECKNYECQDVNIETIDGFETKQGYRMQLPTHTVQSSSNGTFSYEFDEVDNLTITKLIALWVKYMEYIGDGTFRANPDMISENILDYTCSVYYFVLGMDGHTLKYWERCTGVYPASIPYSPNRYSKGTKELVSGSVTFNYMHREQMNPKILEDFNRVSLNCLSYNDINYNLDYDSMKNSSLLNYDTLKNGKYSALVNSDERDPLIFYNQADKDSTIMSDSLTNKYELSFGKRDTRSPWSDEIYGDDFDYTPYNSKL